MTLTEIKTAVDAGQTVHWANQAYVVIKDKLGRYLIRCLLNDNYTGLTDASGDMNEKEEQFFLPDA